jgi:hypothetical protein
MRTEREIEIRILGRLHGQMDAISGHHRIAVAELVGDAVLG